MVGEDPNEELHQLWKHYASCLAEFDDISLARWLSQTLGQLHGKVWRLSHPLVGVCRLLAQEANRRGIWKRELVALPFNYQRANCCHAPFLPLVTRDVIEHGLLCEHCGATGVEMEDLPPRVARHLTQWAEQYADLHEVAHWEEAHREAIGDYEDVFEQTAMQAQAMLEALPVAILPPLLDTFPAVVWEDHDECLDIRPEELEI